jgi:hypothetical protein
MDLKIRKIATYLEETLIEGEKPVKEKCVIGAAMAVIKNPYAGCGFVEDLTPMTETFAPKLTILHQKVVELVSDEVEAFGKGVLVGTAGEIEHGCGLVHNRKFTDPFREATKGTSRLPSVEKRGVCGSSIDIPLKHKTDTTRRSHHMTFEVRIPDAPFPDEIVVICAVSTKGRPHARIPPAPGKGNHKDKDR